MTSSLHFNEAQAAEYLGIAPKTLGGWRGTGKGPAYCKFGAAVRYSIVDLQDFAALAKVLP